LVQNPILDVEVARLIGQSEIEILLATFNGQRFLREQIDSILAQDYKNLRLLARDDGSTDETPQILRDYAEQFPDRIRVMPSSPPTGAAKDNFLLLLKSTTARYVCFADQDDVWLPGKVSLARQAMDRLESKMGAALPLLVFTDLRVVDAQLQTLQQSFWKYEQLDPHRVDRFAALLSQNVVTGCTMMLNRPLIELALRMPPEAVMHDQWIALLASAMGKAAGIDAQTVLYRQHERNVVGSEQRSGTVSEFMQRAQKTEIRLANWKKTARQAQAFLAIYEAELSAENKEVLRACRRCAESTSRVVRIYTAVRYGFLRAGLLKKLATLVDLWKMKVDDP
jgi:glycosyltransferase involved in cell wall biosynthesis